VASVIAAPHSLGRLFMKSAPLFALLALSPFLCPLHLLAQSEKRIQRKDSIVVSAEIPKEQLALEDQLNGIVSKGDEFLRNGNPADAIKEYRSALELIQKQPLLAEREERVEKKLAVGYLQANQPGDAIPIYEKLLDARKQDCGATSQNPEGCADAELVLGNAKMSAGDFSGALRLLKDAESSYERAEKNYQQAEKLRSYEHEFAMIQVKGQAESKALIAVALFMTGKSAEAVTTLEEAISQFTHVRSDETINIGIRDDAARSLKEAQAILFKLKAQQ
jgi:tetratricopeptide (TPR) repeat protein